MKREDYLSYRKDWVQRQMSSDAFVLISNVYIDSFENRTCEGCKYRIFNGEFENDICRNTESLMSEHEVSGDFGCNKWEQK